MEAHELVAGNVYRAAKPARTGSVFNPVYNDRQILYINIDLDTVQYDSPTVRMNRHYPKVTVEKFLKWAGTDVTEGYPNEGWAEHPFVVKK